MAISISFGLMGATLLVLLLVPALYMMLYDAQRICRLAVARRVGAAGGTY